MSGGDGSQLLQQAGDNAQQQASASADKARVRQVATRGDRESRSRAGWYLIGGAAAFAVVLVVLGILGVVPWFVTSAIAVAALAVAAVVRFN